MSKYIRLIAICIFYYQGKILVTQGYDNVRKEKFYRPIGGGIDFGETSQQALMREIKEELNTKITALKKIGVFENIFTYRGKRGHEIIFVYDAKFVDSKFYSKNKIVILEEGIKSQAVWLNINDIDKKNILLYPVGLKQLIDRKFVKNKK